MRTYIILSFILVAIIGLVTLVRRHGSIGSLLLFATTYRNKLIDFANAYVQSFDRYLRIGSFDTELYMWLVKNADKIQSDLGHIGTMHYIGPFQTFQIKNYQVILNTLPKFRDGKITDFDIHACDDALLRYIGATEGVLERIKKKIKNPFVWMKEGFQEIFSLPVYILNWFGIVNDLSVSKLTTNVFYKLITGIGGLVTFVSGLVTIIQGKDETIELIKKLWPHH